MKSVTQSQFRAELDAMVATAERKHPVVGSANCSAAVEACKVILQCEQDRLNAQLSGLETGWEHPGTRTMFNRALFMARKALSEQPNDPDQRPPT